MWIKKKLWQKYVLNPFFLLENRHFLKKTAIKNITALLQKTRFLYRLYSEGIIWLGGDCIDLE